MRREPVARLPPLCREAERERHEPERDEDQHRDDHAGADASEPERAHEPRRATGQHDERDDRRSQVQQPEEVEEALVFGRASDWRAPRRSGARRAHRRRGQTARSSARAGTRRRARRRTKPLPLPTARCRASQSSPMSTLTRRLCSRYSRRSTRGQPRRSGASATSSATGRRRTAAVEIVAERADVCLIGNHDLVALGTLDVDGLQRRGRGSRALDARRARRTFTRLPLGARAERRRRRRRDVPREPARSRLGVRAQRRDGVRRASSRPTRRSCSSGTATSPSRSVSTTRSCTEASPRSGTEVELYGRWLLNPGSVGQPRDGDRERRVARARHRTPGLRASIALHIRSSARRRRSGSRASRRPLAARLADGT